MRFRVAPSRMEIEFVTIHGFPAGVQVVLKVISSPMGMAEASGEVRNATRVMTNAKMATMTTCRHLNIV
jgi:hypothetical protein